MRARELAELGDVHPGVGVAFTGVGVALSGFEVALSGFGGREEGLGPREVNETAFGDLRTPTWRGLDPFFAIARPPDCENRTPFGDVQTPLGDVPAEADSQQQLSSARVMACVATVARWVD